MKTAPCMARYNPKSQPNNASWETALFPQGKMMACRHDRVHADPAPLRLAGQAGWMPTAHALGLGDVRLKLTRPIAPPKWLFRSFGFFPFRE